MEAEYCGEVQAACELLFMYHIISEFSSTLLRVSLPIRIFADNTGAIKFSEELSVNNRTKHIDLRHEFLRYYVDQDLIDIEYVCSNDNVADLMTHPVSVDKFIRFTKFIKNISTNTALEIKQAFLQIILKNEPRHRKL